LIDGDRVSTHSFNRLVTAYPGDVDAFKTDVAERLIRAIAPDAEVTNIRHHLPHPDAVAALQGLDLIFGALDHDGPRLDLTDLASRHGIIYRPETPQQAAHLPRRSRWRPSQSRSARGSELPLLRSLDWRLSVTYATPPIGPEFFERPAPGQ
jgi:hypothetical protein